MEESVGTIEFKGHVYNIDDMSIEEIESLKKRIEDYKKSLEEVAKIYSDC